MDSSRDEHAIRYEIKKKKYTGVVCAKGTPMIKLKWNSIEVYQKRIQLGNSFWDENCLPLSFWFGFYNPCLRCLKKYMHLWDMEPLVLIAGFYCLPTTIRPLVPNCPYITP